MPVSDEQHVWNLTELLSTDQCFALLLLNTAVTDESADLFRKLWCNASVRVTVDGGTNNYHSLIRGCTALLLPPLPTRQKDPAAGQVQTSSNGGAIMAAPLNRVIHANSDSQMLYSTVSSQQLKPECPDVTSAAYSNGLNGSAINKDDDDCSPGKCSIRGIAERYQCKYDYVPLPHFISGDFDSVDPIILQHYEELGVQVIHTPNQDECDFTKALMELKLHMARDSNEQVQRVLVAAGVGHNRFDHVMGNINTLHKAQALISQAVILVTASSVMFVLHEGSHVICPPGHSDPLDNWCSYVPFSGPTIVTTTGLKWDVVDTVVQFGGLVSTSNQFSRPDLPATITTNRPLLFLMSIPKTTYVANKNLARLQGADALGIV